MKRTKEQREAQRERMKAYWAKRRAREGNGEDGVDIEGIVKGVKGLAELFCFLRDLMNEERGAQVATEGGDGFSGGSSPSTPTEETVVIEEPVPPIEKSVIAHEILSEVSEDEFRRRYLAKKLAAIGGA